MGILDLLKPKKKTDLRSQFVPVIFANGRDDDLPGLQAAVRNEAVQFDERIYQPDESLQIIRRTIAFSAAGLWMCGPDVKLPANVPNGWCCVRLVPIHGKYCSRIATFSAV